MLHKTRPKFSGQTMRSNLATIEREGSDLIRQVARSEPAKVVAIRAGITPRHVANLREGECQPRWLHFIALAQQYPELRAAVARWLDLGNPQSPSAEALLDQIRRMVDSHPEEGDRAP